MSTPGKNSKTTPVFLIHGENEFLASTKARDIINQQVPPDQRIMGLKIIDAKADNVPEALSILSECLEAARTIGFLQGRKVVWLRDATFFDRGVVARSKTVQESVDALSSTIATGMPEGHTLIVTAPVVDKKSAFFKTCAGSGEVIHFDVPKPSQRGKEAVQHVRTAFRKHGLRAAENVIAAFVEKVGTDTRQLEQEINKLSLFLDARKDVRLDDLKEIVSTSRETFLWDLQDAVGTRDAAQALKILRQLLFENANPIGLVACMESRFRYLLIFREALDNRWLHITGGGSGYSSRLSKGAIPDDMERLLSQALTSDKGKLHPYVEKRVAAQARAFTHEQLVNCRNLILETRRALVSTSVPGSVLLELLVIKLCRKRRSRRQDS